MLKGRVLLVGEVVILRASTIVLHNGDVKRIKVLVSLCVAKSCIKY